MKPSTIGWTDFSGGDLNFVIGCTPASEGCANCYARSIIQERGGRDFSQIRLYPEKLERLRKTKFPEFSPKRGAPYKPMAFVVDLGDLFHEDVPDDFIEDALYLMKDRRDVIWQVLTKRPERMRDVVLEWMAGDALLRVPDNIWLLATVENRKRMQERFLPLIQIPAVVHGLSMEPMLESIEIAAYWWSAEIQWVICGAESGYKRRPFEIDWAEDMYEQCQMRGIPFFGKQASNLYPGSPLLIKGQPIKQWPLMSSYSSCANLY